MLLIHLQLASNKFRYIDITAMTTKTINQQLLVEKVIIQALVNRSIFFGGQWEDQNPYH